MFETIFSAALKERSYWLKQTKASMFLRSDERLEEIALVVRMGVEITISGLKQKTVKAICEHIQQMSKTSSPKLFQSLALNYLKALKLLLACPMHIEHLLPEEWMKLTEFVCTSLDVYLQDSGTDSPAGSNYAPSSLPSSTLSRTNLMTSELMYCLEYLTAVPHAWIIEKETSKLLVEVLLKWLEKYRIENASHQPAFSALNSTLKALSANNLQTMADASSAVIPIINRFWQTKRSGLKEQMTITMIYCLPHLQSLLRQLNNLNIRRDLEELLETLQSEYTSRLDRDQFQIDHIQFINGSSCFNPKAQPLKCGSFALRKGIVRSEHNWMVLQLISTLMHALDDAITIADPSAMDVDQEDGAPFKRRKITTNFEGLQRQIQSSALSTKISGLHIMPFFMESWKGEMSALDAILSDLLALCSDDNADVNTWSLLALISYVLFISDRFYRCVLKMKCFVVPQAIKTTLKDQAPQS